MIHDKRTESILLVDIEWAQVQDDEQCIHH
jgi:hypothetical protein